MNEDGALFIVIRGAPLKMVLKLPGVLPRKRPTCTLHIPIFAPESFIQISSAHSHVGFKINLMH